MVKDFSLTYYLVENKALERSETQSHLQFERGSPTVFPTTRLHNFLIL